MAAIPGSVSITGFIAPTDSADVFATQDETYNRGGFRTVADLTARNAITSDRRLEGMLVRVLSTSKFYTLSGGIGNGNWIEEDFSGAAGSLTHKGDITLPAHFPTSGSVQVGDLYGIKADVTDNDPSKTNTGQSFVAGGVITWDGSGWDTINTSYELTDGAVTDSKIASSAVTAAKIKDGEVGTDELADDAVTDSKIASSAVTAEKIKDGEVGTDELADDAVTDSKIASSAVTADKIKNGEVGTVELADSAVASAKLANSAVTTAKIAHSAVTTDKIADGAVDSDRIKDSTITLAGLKVTGDATLMGSVTYIGSTNVVVTDPVIMVGSGATGASAVTDQSGLEVERGSATNASIYFDESSDAWFVHDGTSAAEIQTVSGGATFVDNEVKTAASTITTFALNNSPDPTTSLKLYFNGQRWEEGAGNDYTLTAGSLITLLAASMTTADKALMDYRY